MNLADYNRKIEFVCSVCLHAVTTVDTGPWPRCWRGHGRMEPDSDEPVLRPQTARRLETLRQKMAAGPPEQAPGLPAGQPRSKPAEAL